MLLCDAVAATTREPDSGTNADAADPVGVDRET